MRGTVTAAPAEVATEVVVALTNTVVWVATVVGAGTAKGSLAS